MSFPSQLLHFDEHGRLSSSKLTLSRFSEQHTFLRYGGGSGVLGLDTLLTLSCVNACECSVEVEGAVWCRLAITLSVSVCTGAASLQAATEQLSFHHKGMRITVRKVSVPFNTYVASRTYTYIHIYIVTPAKSGQCHLQLMICHSYYQSDNVD